MSKLEILKWALMGCVIGGLLNLAITTIRPAPLRQDDTISDDQQHSNDNETNYSNFYEDIETVLSVNSIPNYKITNITLGHYGKDNPALLIQASIDFSKGKSAIISTLTDYSAVVRTNFKVVYQEKEFLSYYGDENKVKPLSIDIPQWRDKAEESSAVYIDEKLNIALTKSHLDALKYIAEGGELYGELVSTSETDNDAPRCFVSLYIEDSMYMTEGEKSNPAVTTLDEYIKSGEYDKYKAYIHNTSMKQ